MSKYDEAFKWQVVEQCLRREASVRDIAHRHDLDYSMVRRWVERYQLHGMAGLRPKHGGLCSAAFKLSVLETMRREGLSYRQTAILFDIRSDSDVGKWERLYHTGGLHALAPRRKGRSPMTRKPVSSPSTAPSDDERTREELLEELAYLRAENDYLKKLDALIQEMQATRDSRRKLSKG